MEKKCMILSICLIFIALHAHGFEPTGSLIARFDYGEAVQNKYESAKMRAKELFIAIANADVVKLKKLLTTEYYRKVFPYEDNQLRKILLSVPIEKRQRMINQISNNTKLSTIPNRAGDVVTVILSNTVTCKEFTVQLIDEKGNEDWKIFNYEY